MNLTNQSHPFRFPQPVRRLRWTSWTVSQPFSIVRPGAGAANVRRPVPATTRDVLSPGDGAARSAPPTFSSDWALCRTMRNLLVGPAKQILLAGAFLQALW